jgi:hypothetical protein
MNLRIALGANARRKAHEFNVAACLCCFSAFDELKREAKGGKIEIRLVVMQKRDANS